MRWSAALGSWQAALPRSVCGCRDIRASPPKWHVSPQPLLLACAVAAELQEGGKSLAEKAGSGTELRRAGAVPH